MIVAIVILVGAIALFAGTQMTKNSQTKTDVTMTTESTPSMAPSAMMEHDEDDKMMTEKKKPNTAEKSTDAREIVVQGSNFMFDPTDITVKKGEKVRILFKNAGGFHDFVVDELNIKTAIIKDNEEDFVEFTADKPGTYEFYCSVGDHRKMGMKGTLTVE